jgi:5-methylcytosine-specific restriction endonuclease McrA
MPFKKLQQKNARGVVGSVPDVETKVQHGSEEMTPRHERMTYLRRTRAIYDRQREQAHLLDRTLGYSLADLRGFLALRLLRGRCTYCGERLDVQRIEADYLIPIRRGGRFSFSNLDAMCSDCFLLRAGLDAQEFRQIWHVLHEWARPLRRHHHVSGGALFRD